MSHSSRSRFSDCGGQLADAALALHRLDQDRGGFRGDRLGRSIDVVERHLVEAVDLGPEAFQIFLLAAGGDRRQRAAVEGAFEGDGAIALGMAVHVMVAARRLDRAFQRLGARIGEEDLVGEGVLDEPLGKPALVGDLVEIGDVPELAGLLGQRRDQMRMAVAERIDGDAAGEIEIALAIGLDQPDTLAPLEREGSTRKGLVKRRTAHYLSLQARSPGCSQATPGFSRRSPGKIKKAAHAAAFEPISRFSAMKSTKTSANQAAVTIRMESFPGLPLGKLGKTEKTDSSCLANSCHGVSR